MATQKATATVTTPTNGEVSNDTKTIVTVLLLLFVYPVGLILMWVWTSWPKWLKFLLTLPVVLFILGMIAVFATIILIATSQTKDYRQLEKNVQYQYEENGTMMKSADEESTEAGSPDNSDAVEWEMSY